MACKSPPGSFFSFMCLLHSLIALTCGSSIMLDLHDISVFGFGSTPRDQILIQASDSFAGFLLFSIGLLLFMVAFVKDSDFQSFFAKGCVFLHLSMGLWRVCFERRVEDLAKDWPRQLIGDFALAFSWVFFLVHSWNEKYD